jgi:D-beta-D-heptose 7-phosphate kinase/D-beta-D-heptose 1-phosphate adenosyltransferase
MVKNKIFTCGCFDILHIGHVRLLKYAKSLGKELIIGLNTDESIKRLKGDKRPINKFEHRKEILEGLSYVDAVIGFSEDTPYNLMKKINPDVIVKGGDYTPQHVVGNDLCEVIIFNLIDDISTTNILKKLRNN